MDLTTRSIVFKWFSNRVKQVGDCIYYMPQVQAEWKISEKQVNKIECEIGKNLSKPQQQQMKSPLRKRNTRKKI